MIHPELHHRVDRFRRADAFHEAVHRLVDHRHQHPVRDEAGIVVHLDRRLPELRCASSTTRCVVSSDVASPRMISTSFITGTGFMKCIPITCSGRFVRAAISVIEIELRVRREHGARRRRADRVGEDPELEIAVLRRRFDDERRARHGVERRAACVTRPRIAPSSLAGERALLDLPVEVLLDRRAAARRARPATTSIIVTAKPDCAKTCAIPLPICPAPIDRDAVGQCLRLLAARRRAR